MHVIRTHAYSLHEKRFRVFLISLISLIMVNLMFPEHLQSKVGAVLILQNAIVSYLLFLKKSPRVRIFIFILILLIFLNLLWVMFSINVQSNLWPHLVNFIYFCFITVHVLSDVYRMKDINQESIYGIFAGFIAISIIAGFLFMILDSLVPGSFEGIEDKNNLGSYIYFSFITLMTIGYGDISPISELARKLVVTIALIGHFYTVFVTAIIVGKMSNK